jgi:hypothetical protein
VATGETRGKKKKAAKSTSNEGKKAGENNEAPIDWNIYDPAVVDSEVEYRTRSGKEKLQHEFMKPAYLNFTDQWATGRMRKMGRTLYVDGKPWLMRALCYSPVPVGWDPDWFEPYGDFFTSEYAGIYERDIPLMAAAGVNALRIYTLKFSHRHNHFFDLCMRHGINIIVGYDFEDGTKSFFNDAVSMRETQLKIKSLLRAARHPAVGRCSLTVSKPEMNARLVSAIRVLA